MKTARVALPKERNEMDNLLYLNRIGSKVDSLLYQNREMKSMIYFIKNTRGKIVMDYIRAEGDFHNELHS